MTLLLSSAALLGLLSLGCTPSPHIDPPGGGGGSAGGGGSGGTAGMTGMAGSGGTAGSAGSAGAGGAPGCVSNAGCDYPRNVCDVATGDCVECLVTADCSAKKGTVCDHGDCLCPTAGQQFCAADAYGDDRCSDHATSEKDCGECGHPCFGACSAGKCVDVWEPTAQMGAPSARAFHVAVWTGSAMIVWGGRNNTGLLDTGAAYDPVKRVWTPISTANSPSPREYATAVWADGNMIVWGGRGPGGQPLGDGGVYNPTTKLWTKLYAPGGPAARFQHTALWTGGVTKQMIIWGGYDGSELKSGGVYSAAADAWSTLIDMSPPPERHLHTAVWDDVKSRMIVFGGYGFDSDTGMIGSLNSTGIFGSDTWTPVGKNGTEPEARHEHTAVWATNHMIVWGGVDSNAGNKLLNDGARFDVLDSNDWSVMGGAPPSARRRHTAVFFKALNKMIVWGGYGAGDAVLDDGGAFDTAANSWSPVGVPKGPDASVDHTAIGTDQNTMIIWGGRNAAGGYSNKGAVLDVTKVN